MSTKEPKRYGKVIYIHADKLDEYKKLHAKVWPAVLARLEKSNIRNFTIYYCKELGALFSHYEYVGTNHQADMDAIAQDKETKEWWKVKQLLVCL